MYSIPYLLGLKLKYVKHACNSHFEKHSSIATTKLHYISQLRWVQILLGNRTKKVNLHFYSDQLPDRNNDANNKQFPTLATRTPRLFIPKIILPGKRPMGSSILRTLKKTEFPYGRFLTIRRNCCLASSLVEFAYMKSSVLAFLVNTTRDDLNIQLTMQSQYHHTISAQQPVYSYFPQDAFTSTHGN